MYVVVYIVLCFLFLFLLFNFIFVLCIVFDFFVFFLYVLLVFCILHFCAFAFFFLIYMFVHLGFFFVCLHRFCCGELGPGSVTIGFLTKDDIGLTNFRPNWRHGSLFYEHLLKNSVLHILKDGGAVWRKA